MAHALPDSLLQDHALILFDGVCNLCNSSVNFIIDRDPEGYFKFAALQDEAAQPILDRYGLSADYTDSIVLIEDGQCYRQSDAALRVARHLRGAWPVLHNLVLLPRPLRDALYDWIARNRYRWFGKRDTCRIPTPELRARFL
ncbi:MAG TPA: thiol-disulfide oxidoreductase DCC family protein [Rhodothermales bacterium]|nr:thiol-disulfide oxidoreductase DCC family protein [Rhodothermales bacterium]